MFHTVVPALGRSGRGEALQTVEGSVVVGGHCGGGEFTGEMNKWSAGDF